MFSFLRGLALLALNFLSISRAVAAKCVDCHRGVMSAPVCGWARCAALMLGLAVLPTAPSAAFAETRIISQTNGSSSEHAPVCNAFTLQGYTAQSIRLDSAATIGSVAFGQDSDGGLAIVDGNNSVCTPTRPRGTAIPGGFRYTFSGCTLSPGTYYLVDGTNSGEGYTIGGSTADAYPKGVLGCSTLFGGSFTPGGTLADRQFTVCSDASCTLAPGPQGSFFAYIPNIGDNTVSVIDTATDTVTATVPLGAAPSGFVAVSPDSTKVYVANRTGGVSVINAASNTVTGEITVGSAPTNGVAFTPDGTKAYVASSNDRGEGWVSVIDTAANKVIGPPIPLYLPGSIAVTPDGSKAYVGLQTGGLVAVIDTATNSVTAEIGVRGGFAFVAVTPDGTRVYVGNQAGGVSVIDTATNTVTASILEITSGTAGVAVSPDGRKAYVTGVQLH